MVILFKKNDLAKQVRDENSYVLVMKPRGKELSYSFGALWSGQQGGVQTREELEAYLLAELERRTMLPRIRLKTERAKYLGELASIDISIALAESEMERRGDSLSHGGWDAVSAKPSGWTYTTGLLMQSMDDLSMATGNTAFAEYAARTMDSYVSEDGSILTYKPEAFNIDQINSGKMLQRLYARNNDSRYRAAIDSLAAQLAEHPRTSEGALWHKKRYPWQLWLDGVYMGMPFLAGVGVMEGDQHKIEEAAEEFIIARSHLRDAETGLYYHAWDEAKEQVWADSETGRSRYVWARGFGWYTMAIVDILDVIPAGMTDIREPLLAIIPELAESLIEVQDETGVWYQVMDMPEAPGNYLEASGSAMFTYFLAKAVNKGYLPATYIPAVTRAWNGLVNEFIAVYADGSTHVTNVALVAGLGYGRDGSYRYYMSEPVVANDPKGLSTCHHGRRAGSGTAKPGSRRVKMSKRNMTRRDFIGTGSALGAGALLAGSPLGFAMGGTGKKRLVLVGTGVRGTSFWGRFIKENYSDVAEFVGLCDINPGRLEFARGYIGVPDCPVFENFDEMIAAVKPDLVMVTTVDNTHDEFIVKSLAAGIDVVTEKPMTTTAGKCQSIVDAATCIFSAVDHGLQLPLRSAIHPPEGNAGRGVTLVKLTSVDFNWYLNNYHGASYFRRWHGIREKGGTLLLHKAAHHFDLLNWWIGSDPVEVHAYGGLEHYGHNNSFRSERCTACPHKDKCAYFWDISKDEKIDETVRGERTP